ncbi:MAG: molybdopterin molybdotransferase MoeA [Vicinamibacteria bacterium]|nr:molybdopterin molybdotransferase MoeA [Vicinamibacteria bacterium]
MITVDEARAVVLGHVITLPVETGPLAQAEGRILRAPVASDRDLPPFNRAAMDGFAVRSADTVAAGARLRVAGEVRAGVWPDREVGPREAFRIMTGAPVPQGADAVIQVERTKLDGPADVFIETSVAAGQNIVPKGSEATQGAVLLDEGVRIGGAQLAVMASVGVIEPVVARKPRVAVIVTGDEVVDPGTAPSAAQIRNANGPALISAIREAGGAPTDFGVVKDDPETTRAAIARALDEGYDAIVLSGGVSAGDFDFVEPALAKLGVALHVTAVQVKPGAPFVFGSRGETLVFGLPGNPVSAQVTFELFARPALLKMQGARACLRPVFQAILEAPLQNRSGRRNYLPVVAAWKDGALRVRPLRTQGSGDLVAHSQANALAILEPDQTAAAAGDPVLLHPLSSFIEV